MSRVQRCIELVVAVDSCVEYLVTQSSDGSIHMTDIRLLPRCVVVLIELSYTHCKVMHSSLCVSETECLWLIICGSVGRFSVHTNTRCFCFTGLLNSPPVDIIWVMMTIWRISGENYQKCQNMFSSPLSRTAWVGKCWKNTFDHTWRETSM